MESSKSYNKLAKWSFFLILASLTNLGIGAIFWVLLAKLAAPAIIGQAMVVTGFATTLIGFSGYGIQAALSKYMSEFSAKNMQNAARKILKNGIKVSLILSGVMAVAIALLSGQIASMAYNDSSLSLLLVFTIVTYLPTWTVVAALQGAFQGVHIMKYVMVTDLIFQVARMGFVVAALYWGMDVFGILLGFAIASFLTLAISYFYLLPRAIPASNEKEEQQPATKGIIGFTSLNYFTVGIKVLSAQLGTLILGTQSFEYAAFYGLALLVSKIVGSFSQSVAGALLPTASAELVLGNKDGLRKLVNTSVRISILISGFGFIILMIDPAYFLSLISDSYAEAALALRILTVSAVLISITSILTSLLNAANRASDVARIGLISSMITIGLTFVLTPLQGIEGAAIAMLAGSVVGLGMSLVALKQKENMIISSRSIIKPFVAIMSGLMVGYLFVLWNQVELGVFLALACYALFAIACKATTKGEIRHLLSMAIGAKAKSRTDGGNN
jgi:O-antigen/teichoic acid export membrane protein